MIKLNNLLKETVKGIKEADSSRCNECGRDWNHGKDHEAGMAKNELRDMISNASKIDQMVGKGDNLPGWVSAYISLAADYMHSVSEYLAGETSQMQQEPGPGYNEALNESIDLKRIEAAETAVRSLLRNISTNSNIPTLDKEGILNALKELQEFIDEVGFEAEIELDEKKKSPRVRETRGDIGRTHSASSRDYGVPYTPKTDYRVGQKFHHKEYGTGEILKVEPATPREQAIEKGATIFVKFTRKDDHGNNVVKNTKLNVRTLAPTER